jgi:hypothetical protein
MFHFIVAAALIGIVVFQIWLTITVFRSPAYEREQKIRQAQLIWLLPIVGATLVFTVLRESNAEHQTGTNSEHQTSRSGRMRS